MGLFDILKKAAGTLLSQGEELQTCVSIFEDFSDRELKECLNNHSDMILKFRYAFIESRNGYTKNRGDIAASIEEEAESINPDYIKLACRKVAIDRGLIQD